MDNHDGVFPSSQSFMEMQSNSVFIGAWKESEQDAREIVRLYENVGESQTICLKRFGKTYWIDMSPYEIKTLEFKNDTWTEIYITEENEMQRV